MSLPVVKGVLGLRVPKLRSLVDSGYGLELVVGCGTPARPPVCRSGVLGQECPSYVFS